MRDILKRAISKIDATYVDAMFEWTEEMSIFYSGRELENVNVTTNEGGRVTVIKNGGYAVSSFTEPELIDESLRISERAAIAESSYGNTVELAKVKPVKDNVKIKAKIDPRKISFEEKRELMKHYIDLILKTEKVKTCYVRYSEAFTKKIFVNNEGTEIEQEIVLCRLGGRIIAVDGNIVQMTGFSLGYCEDYERLLNREDVVEKQVKAAVDLLKAEPVKPGYYTIIADQDLAGVFIHEAFGHLSESDDLINNPSLREVVKLNKRLGRDILNVVDNGRFPLAPGTYMYDDEGVPTRKTYIIKDGILVGRLFSRISGGALGGEPTGNFRARDYRYIPLVRMSNIYIENGDTPFEHMLESVDKGLYLCGGKGGQTMGDLFTFGAQYGYLIEKGKITKMIKNVNISGNVFETLANITMVGNDFKMSEWGGCGKSRAGMFDLQMLDKSGIGAPHIKIENVVVGG